MARACGLVIALGLIAGCTPQHASRFAADPAADQRQRSREPAYRERGMAGGPIAGPVTGAIARHEPPERPEPAWIGATPLAAPASPPDEPLEPSAPATIPAAPAAPKPPTAPTRQSRRPKLVDLGDRYPKGAIVVVNEERALYLVGEGAGGRSIRYPVAIGAPAEMWTGIEFIADKRRNPTWHPVAEDGRPKGEPVAGGDPANPLGKHALYLGRTLWRIHGTIAPDLIGSAASNGCIRMLNEHIAELYDRVPVGTEVYVVESLAAPLPTHRGRKIAQMSGG